METKSQLTITSPAFEEGGAIPPRYTCNGDNINPPLDVLDMPYGTQALAIIMEDPDAPKGTFTHWVAWNLPPDISIMEGRKHTMAGANSAGQTGYTGPCPPSGTHRYFFHVYALDAALSIPNGSDRQTLEAVMEPHLIAEGTLMGRYTKKDK